MLSVISSLLQSSYTTNWKEESILKSNLEQEQYDMLPFILEAMLRIRGNAYFHELILKSYLFQTAVIPFSNDTSFHLSAPLKCRAITKSSRM